MAAQKIDPKSLREDTFQNFGFHLIEYVYRRRIRFIAGAIVAVLLVAIGIGTLTVQRYRNEQRAVLFHQVENLLSVQETLNDEQRSKASEALQNFVAEYPSSYLSGVAWMHLARLAWDGGDENAAEVAFTAALGLQKGDTALSALATVGLAKIQERRGEVEASAEIYRGLPESGFADLRDLSLGRIAVAQQDSDRARSHFGAVAKRRPPSVLSIWANEELAYVP
jgi:predicted negative regulator of RcsB-dependent stress response